MCYLQIVIYLFLLIIIIVIVVIFIIIFRLVIISFRQTRSLCCHTLTLSFFCCAILANVKGIFALRDFQIVGVMFKYDDPKDVPYQVSESSQILSHLVLETLQTVSVITCRLFIQPVTSYRHKLLVKMLRVSVMHYANFTTNKVLGIQSSNYR